MAQHQATAYRNRKLNRQGRETAPLQKKLKTFQKTLDNTPELWYNKDS
jgi:hypothetical protein